MTQTYLSGRSPSGDVFNPRFDVHSTTDHFGRQILYYISAQSDQRLPLVLFVAGSGCESNFWKNESGQVVGGYQNVLLQVLNGKAHVMVVEKPGVKYLDSTNAPGTAEKCSEQFKQEQTLDRWAIALDTALSSALALQKVDQNKVIVVGHSEGAVMAPLLAVMNSSVTHVVAISGSGAPQLFDFVVNKSEHEQKLIYADFESMLQDPDNLEKLYWGHPARRWTSFMAHSSAEDLQKTKSKILVVHGTADTSVPVQSFDFLVANLKAKNIKFDYERIEGASHSLNLPSDHKGDGMRREFGKIAAWADLK